MRFKSKQDVWLTLIVWAAMFFLLGSGIYALFTQQMSAFEYLIITLLCIALPLFFLWMWLTTYYVLSDKYLIIRFGPFKKVVLLAAIQSVRKTNNPMSSPALSIKRLEIIHSNGAFVLISPRNREAFIEVLKERCPYIKQLT
ncbi:PH domain-containing protein [Pullulanibacillus camelliae]|uniref:PH domain-containing protein n=1 Tax=Pullulanibacillus camelliae TaxID=1707096 RepID=UPI0016695796|nr:PH domain-containing protein [Pullulanibacillus camelliae]